MKKIVVCIIIEIMSMQTFVFGISYTDLIKSITREEMITMMTRGINKVE